MKSEFVGLLRLLQCDLDWYRCDLNSYLHILRGSKVYCGFYSVTAVQIRYDCTFPPHVSIDTDVVIAL